jgi:hypothetical protein
MKKSKVKQLKAEVERLARIKGIPYEKKYLKRAKRVYLRQNREDRKNFSLLE